MRTLKAPKGLAQFYIIPIAVTVFVSFSDYFSWNDSITVMTRIVFYFLLICIASVDFNYNLGTKTYLIVCIICSIYLLGQVAFHYLVGKDLPILRNYSNYLFIYGENIETVDYYHRYGFRPGSFFTEPSYYAYYFAPIILLLLYSENTNKVISGLKSWARIGLAVIFSLTMLLTTSNLAVVYVGIIWGIFILSNKDTLKIKRVYRMILFLILIIILGWVLNSELYVYLFQRFSRGGSVGSRLYRGFIIFGKLDFFHKIFGTGLNNIASYVTRYNISTIYDEADLNYSVTITNRLITTGIIGFVSLILFVYQQFKTHRTTIQKMMLVIMIINFVFTAGEYSYRLAFTLILIHCISETGKQIRGTTIKI